MVRHAKTMLRPAEKPFDLQKQPFDLEEQSFDLPKNGSTCESCGPTGDWRIKTRLAHKTKGEMPK
jgi:hypothetical protein